MQRHSYQNVSLPALFWLWAKHRIAERLRAMRPAQTCDEIARATALSGNPPGA
ncbi:MAG TPA: hypothetical protein VHD34_02935 [Xanthobacteraceae bacterium]|nr:hypothetical protein [Xanthobacteraceae bacterium]